MANVASNRNTPVIVAVERSEPSRSLFVRELTGRYGRDYEVVVEQSNDAAIRRLHDLSNSGDAVALVVVARGPNTADVLAAARATHPHAKRGLLIEWADNRAAREEIARVLATGQADYYVVKPMTVPDERFHRGITEFLDEWWRLYGAPFEAVRVIADDNSARRHEICDLLHRHDLPYGSYSAQSERGRTVLAEAGIDTVAEDEVVVVIHDGRALVDPTNVEVADALGARTRPGTGVYDVVVVGGGPAGLSVAVGAASEGLRTAVIEGVALGGQAGTSSLIRNYVGFPRGVSGAELAARALDQAILFGAEMVYGATAVSLEVDGRSRAVTVGDGTVIAGRTVVIATGVAYRRLDVPTLERFNGNGVFYGAAMSEAPSLRGERVCVVGGGNSAGQAAIYLAKFAEHVSILVRSSSLAQSMSDYLVAGIEQTRNIDVRYGVEVVDGGGAERLEWLAVRDCSSSAVEPSPASALFGLIGAEPHTSWLPASIARDDWGYVVTGSESMDTSWATDHRSMGPRLVDRQHPPLLFETTAAGVFAIGDVRRGSVKRVASAAGDGAVCVRLIHEYLADLDSSSPTV